MNSFITRPVLASVIAIMVTIVGVLSLMSLPIERYPNVVPPTVVVAAHYAGASAEVVQKTVSIPLEEQINGVDNLFYLTSQCSNDGSCLIIAYFEVGTDPDMATVNVQNRTQRAMAILPPEVTQSGVTVQKRSPTMLALYSLTSSDPAYDSRFLSNYLNINVVNVLKRVDGVGDISVFGGDDYSMRVWLNPERMSGLGITPSDVYHAIEEQNIEAAPGQLGKNPAMPGQEMSYVIRVHGRYTEPEQFANIIVRAGSDGSVVRIGDIGRVELGSKSYDTRSRLNGHPAPAIAIYQAPGSNAVAVKSACDKAMAELAKDFPKGVEFNMALNTVAFITTSVREVMITLLQAFVLVFLVVYVFLQDWRATLIPAITVPVSLVGAFIFLNAFGFSINMLTLFALVLAIGIVVDDAIVVLEAIQEKINNKHLTPLDAAKQTMSEITGAVITITLVLSAVFIPVSFLPGTTGIMYRQFALTLASSIVISAVLALTLTPALSALLLRPTTQKKGWLGKFFGGFNRSFAWLLNSYGRVVSYSMNHIARSFALLLIVAGLMALIIKVLPTGFIPEEDQGYFFIHVAAPKAVSLETTDQVVRQIEELLANTEGVHYCMAVPGVSILDNSINSSNAMIFVTLDSWDERKAKHLHADAIIRQLQSKMNHIPGGIALAFNAPSIPGLGRTGGLEFQLEDKIGAGPDKLAEVSANFVAETQKRKEIMSAFSGFRNDVPQYYLDVDVEKAKKTGVAINDIYSSLQSFFGSLYINDFNKFGKSYRVIMQAEGQYRANPEDVGKIYVRNSHGEMVPLGTFVNMRPTQGPDVVKRFNLFSSSDMSAVPATGYSTGDAIQAVEEVAQATLPYGFGYEYSGMTRQEQEAGSMAPFIFLLSFVFVYLLLCAQYESWLLPLPILLALPFGILGALAFQYFRGLQNNIFAQIGLIMLIGLVAKNAILIVEYARQQYAKGVPLKEATLEGAKLRLRPILMTSLAFLFGVLPLVIASGAGANSRHALGTSVFGGMLLATICGVVMVPVMYVFFQKLGKNEKMKN